MSKDKDDTQSRLDSLRSQLISSPVDFDSTQYEMDSSQLPNVDFDDLEKPIDYRGEVKPTFEGEATDEIMSIISVYIKDDKLLQSARLRTKAKNYIRKYTKLLLILDMYENNLITLQESIDMGDRSKDQYDLVNKTGGEIAKRLEEIDKMLIDCEEFFEEYMERYGMTSEEDAIISESIDDSTDNEDRVTVLTMTEIVNAIDGHLEEKKEEERKREEQKERQGNILDED